MGGKEIFEAFLAFLKESTIKLPFKLFSIILIIFLVVLFDNTLGFSYSYYNKRKLEQVKDINSILKDNVLTDKQKKELITLNDIIIKKKTWISSIYNYIISIKKDNNFIINNSNNKSYVLTYLSSSWIYIITFLIYVFSSLKEKKYLSNCLTGLFLTAIITLGWSTLLYFIPNIYNRPIINYSIYFFLPFLLLFLFGSSPNKIDNKDNNILIILYITI